MEMIFNTIEEIEKYYDEKSNTYVFKENGEYIGLVTFNFDLEVNASIEAYNIKSKNIKAHDIKAHDINVHDINVHNINAHDINGHIIIACDVKANSIDVKDVIAWEIYINNNIKAKYIVANSQITCKSITTNWRY